MLIQTKLIYLLKCLRHPDNDNCIAPTYEYCFNQNSKNPKNPIEKQLIPPIDYLSAGNKCSNPYIACKFIQFLMNRIINVNSSAVPSIKQCLDKNQELFIQSLHLNLRVQESKLQIACKLLGYVSQSETLFKCVLPNKEKYLNQMLYNSDKSVYIQKGYQKVNDDSFPPDSFLLEQVLVNQDSAFQYQGYFKSQNNDSKITPTDCLSTYQCNSDQSVCAIIGYVKVQSCLCQNDLNCFSGGQYIEIKEAFFKWAADKNLITVFNYYAGPYNQIVIIMNILLQKVQSRLGGKQCFKTVYYELFQFVIVHNKIVGF
ncbi:hypothetical protein ABPG72_013308 [Tetrahymena utriculariae]